MPKQSTKRDRMPALFVGHGSPMNAIETNPFTQALQEMGVSLPRPKAILMISAHWTPPYFGVTHHSEGALMYDFFGFPPSLEQVKYPAASAPFLVKEIEACIGEVQYKERALDHGAWSVLVHLFPKADIPVMQFGINSRLSLKEHFEVGKRLQRLREEGVMIIGSGNVTHNLQAPRGPRESPAEGWAARFDIFVKESIEEEVFSRLVAMEHPDAAMAHPSLEHYIPLLYIAALKEPNELSYFGYEAIEYGTLSMRNWVIG